MIILSSMTEALSFHNHHLLLIPSSYPSPYLSTYSSLFPLSKTASF